MGNNKGMTRQQEYQKEEAAEMVQIRDDQSLNYTVTLGVGQNALSKTPFIKIGSSVEEEEGRRVPGSIVTSWAKVENTERSAGLGRANMMNTALDMSFESPQEFQAELRMTT